MNQNVLTVLIGILCMAVPLSFLVMAVKKTPKHAWACPNCNADIPATDARCPRCHMPVTDRDLEL
jgi:predicted amidophosphoribosyltransferase